MATTKKTTKKTAAEAKSKAGAEIGRSGTNNFSGIITEDYNATLSGVAAMKVYDEMRKSDATVKAILQAIQLPIRRAQWFVKPASQDQADVDIANFVEAALFDYQTITWDDFLRQALLSTTYGVMVFEKVFEVKEVDGYTRICWRKFAPRMPKSIVRWEIGKGEDGITQSTLEGKEAQIPMDKLLVFVNEKEGDNWWGISVLRAAYKPWYMKSNLEKIDAIAHERQGLGVPFVKVPKNASAEDITRAETILGNMRASDEGYLVEPEDITVEFKDMKATMTKDAGRAIAYHDRQITKAVLAQFIDLGSGPTGSRALSEDQSNLFLQSLEAIANNIADVVNKYAIKQLVDLNFNGVTKYPEVDYTGISRTDVDKLSTAYQRLVQVGGLRPIESDEQFLREVMGLPERTDDDAELTDDEAVEDTNKDLGIPEDTDPKKKVESSELEKAIDARLSSFSDTARRMDFIERKIETVRAIKKHRKFYEHVESILSARYAVLQRKVFQEGNEFKSWRGLTFAEKKVNFNSIQDFIDKNEAKLIDESRDVLTQAKEDYTRELTDAINKGDLARVKSLELKYHAEYKDVLKVTLKKAFEFGKNNAAREMGVKAPGNPTELMKNLDLAAETIADKHLADIETEAKLAISDRLTRGQNNTQALAAADVSMSAAIDALTRDTGRIVVAGYINTGRATVFEKNANKIHALQRSEILDAVTCNFCLSMDGRIIEKTDGLSSYGQFHSSCRGIWVEILNDEEELPDITGVPNSIRDRLGDSVNELVQPKNPIVRKDSLAGQAIEKGKAGKKEKEASENSVHAHIPGTCGGNPHVD